MTTKTGLEIEVRVSKRDYGTGWVVMYCEGEAYPLTTADARALARDLEQAASRLK